MSENYLLDTVLISSAMIIFTQRSVVFITCDDSCSAQYSAVLPFVLDGQLKEPVNGDAVGVEGGQTGRRRNGTRQVVGRPEVANKLLDGLNQEGLSGATNATDKHTQGVSSQVYSLVSCCRWWRCALT